MLSRALLLIVALLLLSSLTRGGIHRKLKQYAVTQGQPVIRECERKPKLYLCKHLCEANQDCQANNICCSTTCGNVCVNMLDDQVWEEPNTSHDIPFLKDEPFSRRSFEGDMAPTIPSSSFSPLPLVNKPE
ncbi:WAP four-disulfide core domain protein 10A [Phodopus roborovskii]|uniref:Wfdc10a protein n=1 Tax=Phodopus roborovskii TaxID=109678 RepID=A0AAU9YSS4_PHORO|nr:WAP four-disulfide core domain protein 10A [Phodopus roborovskii]CAH6776811.1 Wfdc10a [Phodopus roborovskii]